MWVIAIWLPLRLSGKDIAGTWWWASFENIPPASESPVQSGRPIDLGILSDRD
jgi:hypothetical protein